VLRLASSGSFWRLVALWAAILLSLIFLLAPIAIIVALSFSAARYLQFPPPGFSLQWYREFFRNPDWMSSLWLSLRIALGATATALLLGLLAAVALVRERFPAKTAIYVLVLAPMIVPTIITAIAVYFLFARLRMIGSPIAMALGQAVLVLPLVVIIVSATLQGFDRRLEQAAIILGASPLQAFLRVTVPMIAPGIASAALFAFLSSFDELLIPLLLSSPTTMTLPVRIWTSVIMQIDPTITAVSSFLIALAIAVLGAAGLLRRARGRA